MVQKFNEQLPLDICYCDSWEDMGNAISCKPHQIVVHINTIKRLETTIPEIISMIETRLKLAGLHIPIAVGIEPDTTLSVIKELKKCGVAGIIPSTAKWGPDETITAICSLANRTPYWPKHIISQLPGNKPVIKNKKSGISVTPRQSQVLDLVCNRGLSNKQIAKSLNISESTVKIHIGCILKEYGVRNRTQLVLAASSLLKA
jgi:DNA-binding NarL/FixJ family response regulator